MNAATAMTMEPWRNLLQHSTHEVFEIMLSSALEDSEPSDWTGVEFTAMVGLAGALRGVISVRCGERSATQIASAMLALPPQEAAEHSCDALGEVANMVAGNFKNKIDGMSDKCLLSVPTVITGANYSLHSLADNAPLELWFRFGGAPLQIVLEIHT